MKKYDYLLFDLDGTLTDSYEGITNGVKFTYGKFGKSYKESELYRFIGPPLSLTFGRDFPDEEERKEAIGVFREYYITRGVYENRPYDGVVEMLATLKSKGYFIATATSKQYYMANTVVDYFGLREYIDEVFAADEKAGRNSKADVLLNAVDSLKADRSKCVLIGDTDYDIEGAEKVGIDNVVVSWGYGEKDVENRAMYFVRSVGELIELLS